VTTHSTEPPQAVIAVVDDDLKVRTALQRLFRSAGFQVKLFSSGPEFLATLPAGSPDCLLLDLHMLGLTGIDVQRQLLAVGVKFPVVLITGRDEPGLADRALAAGVAAFLVKPLEGNQLLQTVQGLLMRPTEPGPSGL